MAKQALIDAINESIAPFVHPDDLKPSRLTLSLWSGRIRFPHGLRLNADAINKELAKSNHPSASSDEGHGGGGIGDRIRRRGRGNSMAEGSHPPNYSLHHTSSSVAAGGGPTSAAAADGATPKAASNGGAGGGMWSPFSFGTGWSRGDAATEQQSNSTRERSPAVRKQAKATRRMSNGTAGASTLASDLVGRDGTLNMGGGRDKPLHNSGVSYTTPNSYIDEGWAVNVHLDAYRNAKTEEDHQKAREEAQASDASSRSTNPFLAGLGLPSNVRLISGYVRQIQIDIPWSSLATKPVVIKLSGVKLAVMPTSLSGQNDASSVAKTTPHFTSTGSGGGLFRARGKEAIMRKLRTKEEQTIAAKRRRILMEKDIRKRQQDAFLRCLFEDRTASSGRRDNDTETSGRDSPAPSIASVGSRSTVTGSGSDVLKAAAHTSTSVASTVFGSSSEQRRMSFVLGNEEDDEEGGYGMHSISTSSATSMYHRSSLNTSTNRSQSPFLKSPASESMRKMTKRPNMPNDVFRSRLRRKIMENLCLDVRGIHIQICKPNGADEEATAGAKKKANGFVLGIVLDSLQLYTTDEHGRKVRAQGRGAPVKRSTFLKPKTSGKGVDSTGGRPVGGTFLFKALRVSGLGVYLEEGKSRVEIDEETLFGGATLSSRDNGSNQGDMYGAGSQDSAHRRPSDSGDDISLASMETDGLHDEVLAGGYGRRYVVNPISFEAAYRQRNDELPTVLQSQSASAMTPVQRRQTEKGSGDDETEHLLFSQLPHLSIVLSEPQLRLASEVVDSFLHICGKHDAGVSMVLRPLYPEYRPACSITSLTASDWWRYSIRSVRRMKRPSSFMWRNFMLAFQKKRRYMSLYKRHVAHCDPRDQAFYEMGSSSSHRCTKYCCRAYECLAPADIEAMRAIEDDRFISIEALVGWRAEAEAQLWRERRLQTKAGEVTELKLGESMSRLQSVFQGGLGGFGGSPYPSKGGETEIQVDDMDTSGNQNDASLALTAEDLSRLELQLEAYFDSPSRTSNSRIAELELSLGFVVVDLISTDLSPVAKLRLGTLDFSCALFSNSQSMLSLSLASVLLEDMTTFDPMVHTIMRSVHHAAPMDDNRSCASGHSGIGTSGGSTTQPCSASKFSLKHTATGDLEVSLKMTTFEFLLSPSFSSSLNKFLDLTDDGDDLFDDPGLYRYANEMFRAAIRQLKSRAQSSWDEKCQNGKRWDLDIALDPAILIAPGNAVDADSRAVILSLGQHQLKTTPKKEEKPMGSFAQTWFDEQPRSSEAPMDSTVAATSKSEENERSVVTDRWELVASGITAAIGPPNDENWRHYVVDELIHAGAHSDGNMIAADVRPYVILRPCVFEVDLGSSTSMEKNIIKHRRSWVSVNASSPPLLVRLRSDDIVALGRSVRQTQEFLGGRTPRLPSVWSTDTVPTSGLGEPAVGNPHFQGDDNGPVGSNGILPASIMPGGEQLENLPKQEEPTHAFHFSYDIPRLKVALKLSREGSFITQLDSMCFGLSSNSDKTTSGRFELADAWVFYQVEEAEPTVIFGDRPPNTQPATSYCPDEGKNLVSAELSIAESVPGNNPPLNFPFEAMDLAFRVQTRDVVINMHPKLLRLAIKAYRRIKQGLSFALAPTSEEPTLSHVSTGPGTSTFISLPLATNSVDDDRSVGSNSSSDFSVSTAESLMESRPSRDFLGYFFPALSNAKRDLFRPTSALAVTASFSITSISVSIIPDNNEEPSRFDVVFSDNVFGINNDDDGRKTTFFEIGKVAITSASSYAYRQEYCKVLRGGDDEGAKFLVLDHTKSPSSTVDTETGKIKPQTQTYVRIAPIHCVYLHSQVTVLSDFLHKSGLRAVLAPALFIKKCLAFIDSNELTDIKLQELDIKIPESSTSTTKLAFRVGSTSIVHNIDPSDFAIKAIDLDDINLCCSNNMSIGNPISVSAEITAAVIDQEGIEEVDSKKIVQRIQISSSEVHLAITARQHRQLIATLVNNIGSTSTKVIRDLTGSSPRPRAWRDDKATHKNSSLRSLQSSFDGTGNGSAAGTAVATGNGISNLVTAKIEFSIIIPAISLSLCDESNDPFAKVSAERAATLLEYGTEASPEFSSSLVFGLYSLEITDERSCVDQNDGRYLLRQLFGEGGIREALSISSKENDDGSFKMRANVGAWQINLVPDLLDEAQHFFRLPVDQESLGKHMSLIGMLQKVIPDVAGGLEEPQPSTFELKTSTLKFACFEEPVPEEDAKLRRRRRCITIQFALESKGTVQTPKDAIHLFESQTNVDAIEIYSAKGKALGDAVQIMSPMSLSFFASKSATAEDGDDIMPTLTAKIVVSEPIDLTVSTQDVLLVRHVYLGLQDFSQAAIESLSDSISFLNASATSFGKFDAIADIPQSTSDVPREIDVSSSASQLVNLSVMVPSSTIVLVNDNAALLPTPLFKFTIENIFLESQADIINEEAPSSLVSTILPTLLQFRLSIQGQIFDSIACRWKMSSQCDADVNYHRQQEACLGEGEYSKRLEVELNPFEIVSSRGLFEKLALSSPFIWMIESESGHLDTRKGTRVVTDGPYAIRNYTGFHFHFSLHEQEESYECKAGETKHFIFENTRGFGVGYSRVFGQDFEDSKSISVFEKQDASSNEVDPHLLSLSFEDIDAELGSCRAHKYGDGRIVFSEVVSENGRMILVVRARVLFHNFTRYTLDVGMKLGDFHQSCCSCSGLISQGTPSPDAIARAAQTVALGIPQSDRAAFDEAAEKAKSRLALELRLHGSASDTIIGEGSSFVGTIELPSVPTLNEMTTKGSISETKVMAFADGTKEEGNNENNELCTHITFVSTIMDGHPSVEIYIHPKAILRNTYPTRLYFALSTSHGEKSIDSLQLEAGESVQLFTVSDKAYLRVQAEPLDSTSAVIGAVEVRTAWCADSAEKATSDEQSDPDSPDRPISHVLGTLMIHSDRGVVEGLLNESTWAAVDSSSYLPPTRLTSLDPRHILVDHSNSFSVECSDHPGSLELPSFLLAGVLTTPLPQTDKDPRILLREGTSGRTVLLQARSVPYGRSSVEASPLPLAGNSSKFSGYYALKKDDGAVAGALQFHLINGFNVVNDTPNDLSVTEVSADGRKFTLHPDSSANVSWSTAKDNGMSLSVHHNDAVCSITIAVNSIGEKKYELRGDTFFGRVSVCVVAGDKDARLRVRIHSLVIDDAKGVAPMPANRIESRGAASDGKVARIVWGSGITINRLRVPHLRILQYSDASQHLALFVIDNLDAEYCIDDSSSQRSGYDGLVERSCAMVAARGLTIDDLRSGHSVPIMCNTTGEPTDDLFKYHLDIQKPVQSDILELEVTTSFPTLSKRNPLDATISMDFVEDLSKELRHCADLFSAKASTNSQDRAQSRLRWKKVVVEPLHLSLAVKPGADKRTEAGSSTLVYYIPFAVLNMLGNGQDITARVRLAEFALGDTSTNIDTLVRILQVFYASEVKSCISTEFSEATQSDLLADLRQRREICQMYTPCSEAPKSEKRVLFSDDSSSFDKKLKSLGCKAARPTGGASTAKSDKIHSSSMKKTNRKSSKAPSQRKELGSEAGKARGWFGR